MSKKHPRVNVNGRVPAGTPTFDEMFPIGTQERAVVESKIERLAGMDFLTVCKRNDAEMTALKDAERRAAEEKKRAAIEAAAKRK